MPRRKKLHDEVAQLLDARPDIPSLLEHETKPLSSAAGAIKLETIKIRIDHLLQLKRTADGAATDYAEAVKAVAESANCIPGVVKKFVSARFGEKFIEKKREAEQLSLLFDEIGE